MVFKIKIPAKTEVFAKPEQTDGQGSLGNQPWNHIINFVEQLMPLDQELVGSLRANNGF